MTKFTATVSLTQQIGSKNIKGYAEKRTVTDYDDLLSFLNKFREKEVFSVKITTKK